MKKSILFFGLALFLTAQVFAIKLPEGTNVRAEDIQEDGDIIVWAKLSSPTKINTPIGQLEVKNDVYFYKSGALKSCTLANDEEIEIDIGKISFRSNKEITFYESGSIKDASFGDSVLKTALGETKCCPKTFYDSGNPKIFQLRTYTVNLSNVYYECDLGKFEILDEYTITQYPSGNIRSFTPVGSYDIKTPIGDTFGTGERQKGKIYFRDDGSLIGFTTDDVIKAEIAGTKVNIPAGTYLSFYANGNICDFTASNETSFTIGSRKIDFYGDSTFRASEDGKKIIECPFFKVYQKGDTKYPFYESAQVTQLYNNGVPKQFKYEYKGKTDVFYLDDAVKYIYVANQGLRRVQCNLLKKEYDNLKATGDKKYFYLQEGDGNGNVGMIYFADSGLPSSYALYKYDDFGEILLDDTNKPIIDTENKKKFKKD